MHKIIKMYDVHSIKIYCSFYPFRDYEWTVW